MSVALTGRGRRWYSRDLLRREFVAFARCRYEPLVYVLYTSLVATLPLATLLTPQNLCG
jgi:hypothetical protein